MTFHWIKLRAIVHATESIEKVETALKFVCGGACEIISTQTDGHHGNPIEVLEIHISRKHEISQFFSNLLKTGIVTIDGLAELLDDNCTLHMKFGKQAAYRGWLEFAVDDDIILVTAKASAYPAVRNTAVIRVLEFLKHITS